MSLIEWVLPFVVVLGVLIFVHELGHFFAAKALGVKVERFSLGFGHAILSRTVGETEYRISWLPLGGYVKMLGEIPGEPLPEGEEHRTFNLRPVWQRIVIAGAGPAMNFALPVFLLGAAYLGGVPTATSRIGTVLPGSPAALAGVSAGDRVVSVAGESVEWWRQVADRLDENVPGSVPMVVERRGKRLDLLLEIRKSDVVAVGLTPGAAAAVLALKSPESPAADAGLRSGDLVTRVGEREILDWPDLTSALAAASGRVELELARTLEGGEPETLRLTLEIEGGPQVTQSLGLLPGDLRVHDVQPESPADRAGLQEGDLLVSVDGESVPSFGALAKRIRQSGGHPLVLGLLREGEALEAVVEPEEREIVQGGVKDQVYAIGVRGGVPSAPELRPRRAAGVVSALGMGAAWTGEIVVRTFEAIGMLITGRVGREGLAGPIGIGVIAAQSFHAGWIQGILIMAVISVNLGILNLLPIPVLDGGHILFALVEGVKGSPVSLRIREIGQQMGITVLVLLMVFAFWNDIARHWSDITGFFQGAP